MKDDLVVIREQKKLAFGLDETTPLKQVQDSTRFLGRSRDLHIMYNLHMDICMKTNFKIHYRPD